MRWKGERQSDNLEDRRRMGPRGIALGGGAAVVVLILGLLMGLDPQQIEQLIDNPPGAVARRAGLQIEN